MSNTGTKEKRTKINTLRPPAEIRSNTKARRAWLTEQLAMVKATPNRDGKIVDVGSYQSISVYEVTQVEGRLRHRGACQCCGRYQVVNPDAVAMGEYTSKAELEAGALVMHGYNRPGDGYLIGKCPGVGFAPLNVQDRYTKQWSEAADERLATAEQRVIDATAAERQASTALYSGAERREPMAHSARPQRPSHLPRDPRNWTDGQKTQMAQYEAGLKVWRQNFPLTAALGAAQEEMSYANQNAWQAKQESEHFHQLLASGIHGSPLQDEVVT